MNNNNNKGFTLIELMITVAIISILGTVALPAYQDYTIRSQVAEGLSLASGTKVQVAEYYANHGEFPITMSDLGLVSSQGSFIGSTSLGEKGAIVATFGNESNKVIHNGMISLIPKETSKGNLEWRCESNIEERYLPTSCKYNEKTNSEPEEEEIPYQEPEEEEEITYQEPYIDEDGNTVFSDGMKQLESKKLEFTQEQINKYFDIISLQPVNVKITDPRAGDWGYYTIGEAIDRLQNHYIAGAGWGIWPEYWRSEIIPIIVQSIEREYGYIPNDTPFLKSDGSYYLFDENWILH